jgi:hypothetical protein
VTADNQVRFGNSSVTSIGGQVSYSTFSDARYKRNISENVPGLEFVNRLRPITYQLDVEALARKRQALRPALKEDATLAAPSRIVYTGFVAQEVERAAKESRFVFSGVDPAKNDEDLYGLRYAEFVVPLVRSVQELHVECEKLRNEVELLKGRSSGSPMRPGDDVTTNNVGARPH